MFDSLYPEAADTALDIQARRPPDAPPPTPWFKGAWSAIGKAVPRAGAEMGRAGTSLLTPEAVGAVDAPTMFSAPGKTSKPQLAQEIREQDTALRDAIKEMTPDAQTTGAASMILHDVTRFVGKAAAYSAVGGLPGAVAGVGLDEGTNEALKRMDEGVDPATARKLGVIHGVASAAAVAVPVAGKTIAQTAGLALAGGPGSFIGEQAAARKILEVNGYQEEADRIDPFDPLGLGVSFLGPLLFGAGAHAVRGMNAKAEAKAADARMLANPEPPGQPTKLAQAIEQTYTRDHVDAARVTELQAHREAQALHAREDVAAGAAHERALDRATEQLASGQRVSVADVAPVEDARITEVMDALRDRVDTQASAVARRPELAAWMEERGILPQDLAEAQAVKGNPFVAMLKDAGGVSSRMKFDIVGERGIRGNYAGMFTKDGLNLDLLAERARDAGFLTQADIDNPADIGGTRALSELIRRATAGEKIQPVLDAQAAEIQRVKAGATAAAIDHMERELRALGVDPAAARGDADVLGNFLSENRDALVESRLQEIEVETRAERQATAEAFGLKPEQVDEQTRVALASELDENAVIDAAMQATDGVDFMRRVEEILSNAPRRPEAPAGRNGSATDAQLPGGDGARAGAGADGADAAAGYYAAEADRVAELNPDLPVMLEGMDAPMPASQLLAEIKAQAAQANADAPLLKVAAECALMG